MEEYYHDRMQIAYVRIIRSIRMRCGLFGSRSGFTLLEIVIYFGIVALVTVPALSLAWLFIGDAAVHDRVAEVDAIGSFAFDRIAAVARGARTVDVATVYGIHPGALVVTRWDGTRVVVDSAVRTIAQGGRTVAVRALRVQDGSNPTQELTSDAVDVTQFILRNRSVGGVPSIEVELELQAVNPDRDPRYGATRRWTTAITLRR